MKYQLPTGVAAISVAGRPFSAEAPGGVIEIPEDFAEAHRYDIETVAGAMPLPSLTAEQLAAAESAAAAEATERAALWDKIEALGVKVDRTKPIGTDALRESAAMAELTAAVRAPKRPADKTT